MEPRCFEYSVEVDVLDRLFYIKNKLIAFRYLAVQHHEFLGLRTVVDFVYLKKLLGSLPFLPGLRVVQKKATCVRRFLFSTEGIDKL